MVWRIGSFSFQAIYVCTVSYKIIGTWGVNGNMINGRIIKELSILDWKNIIFIL